MRTFSQNDKQLQGMPGATTVLHINTRWLDWHPHIHLVMPAADVDGEKKWRIKRRVKIKVDYLFKPQVLQRGCWRPIETAGLALPDRYPEEWVVDCKSVGTGEKALIYLGHYLYRGVIREKDIVACNNGQVSFRYRNARIRRTVSGVHFLWLLLQHVLPKGFRRARNFGFLHPNCKRLIEIRA